MAQQDTPAAASPAPAGTPPPPSHLSAKARALAGAFRQATIAPSLVIGAADAFQCLCLILLPGLLQAFWLAPRAPAAFIPTVAAALATVAIDHLLGNNSEAMLRHQAQRLGRILAVWSGVFGALALALFIGDLAPALPKSWYPAWYAAGFATEVMTSAVTALLVRQLARSGRLRRRAVIVGGGPLAESLIAALETSSNNEIRVLGIFDDRSDARSPESQMGFPKLGTVSDLVEFARLAAIDIIIVALPPAAETRILQLLKTLWVLPVDIRLAAHASQLRLRPRSYSYIGGVPFLDLFDRPIAGWNSVVKRIFDVVIACLAIVALSPLLIGTAIAVKATSRGPVLFRQKRYGFNNEVIEVMKFRSMYHEMADYAAARAVTRGDARVTPIGRFIRRTSIDELPQLFNVLKGELSLVGPRPHAVNAHTEQRLWEEVVDGYFARHKVKPGVTGWAQINGWRGEVDRPDKIRARVDHDLYYIEHWSVAFDLYILLLTPFRILNQENAY